MTAKEARKITESSNINLDDVLNMIEGAAKNRLNTIVVSRILRIITLEESKELINLGYRVTWECIDPLGEKPQGDCHISW